MKIKDLGFKNVKKVIKPLTVKDMGIKNPKLKNEVVEPIVYSRNELGRLLAETTRRNGDKCLGIALWSDGRLTIVGGDFNDIYHTEPIDFFTRMRLFSEINEGFAEGVYSSLVLLEQVKYRGNKSNGLQFKFIEE